MSAPDSRPARLPISAEVAEIVAPGAPRDVQLKTARGAGPLAGAELLTALAFLCTNADSEVKSAALATLRGLPEALLLQVLEDPGLHHRLLDLLARVRMGDVALMARVIAHPSVAGATLHFLAERADRPVLESLAGQLARLTPETVAALLANPRVTEDPDAACAPPASDRAEPVAGGDGQADDAGGEDESVEEFPPAVEGDPRDVEEVSDEHVAALLREAETKGLSKYQLAMELKVSEKIKVAMTGDKEWRKILIKDPNKLVHGAVLRNGRITEGEVLMVAKNKSASDELVRLIIMNRDWMKNYEMRKALVTHPKTPLPKALRFVSELTLRDLKELARSRNVSNVIATSARKEVERKTKRGG